MSASRWTSLREVTLAESTVSTPCVNTLALALSLAFSLTGHALLHLQCDGVHRWLLQGAPCALRRCDAYMHMHACMCMHAHTRIHIHACIQPYACMRLPFEGFLEALVRLATCIPIPTDVELEASEFTHAGPFMGKLEAGDNEAFQLYLQAQTCEWGDVPNERVSGHMVRREV